MGGVSRRAAVEAGLLAVPRLTAARSSNPVGWFNLKNVMIDGVDEKARTLSMTLGKLVHSPELKNISAAKDIGVRVSHLKPGAANNLPFSWDRVRKLVGVPVSVLFYIKEDGLEVASIASAND